MAREAKRKSKQPEITINIKGVKSRTRIGDLTVDQFIKLLFQVFPQLLSGMWQDRVASTERILGEIRKSILNSRAVHHGTMSNAVRDMQLEVLHQMPELMKRVASASPRDNEKNKQ